MHQIRQLEDTTILTRNAKTMNNPIREKVTHHARLLKAPQTLSHESRARTALAPAFRASIPIMAGYGFLGLTYGIYMHELGFNFLYPMLLAITVYAGSAEFLLGNMLVGSFHPLQAFLMVLMVNARHLFYGLTMLEGTGLEKVLSHLRHVGRDLRRQQFDRTTQRHRPRLVYALDYLAGRNLLGNRCNCGRTHRTVAHLRPPWTRLRTHRHVYCHLRRQLAEGEKPHQFHLWTDTHRIVPHHLRCRPIHHPKHGGDARLPHTDEKETRES